MKFKTMKKITLWSLACSMLGSALLSVGSGAAATRTIQAEEKTANVAVSSASFTLDEPTTLYPATQEGGFSDTYAASQEKYLYSRIGLEKDGVSVRDITKGATDKHRSRIVVIDSGVNYEHEDFLAADGSVRFSPLSYNVTMRKTVEQAGYSILSDSEIVDGHGTQVCGPIFAVGDNGKGIAGLAEDAELIFIKVTPTSEGGYDGNEISSALEYAATLKADVVNMSMGSYLASNPYASSIRKIRNSGALIVAAAGNVSTSNTHYPSADPNVIAVGAFANMLNLSTQATQYSLANYSTYGDHNLTLCAPGTFYTTKMDGTYGASNGTSIATPIVSSAIALYRSLYPDSTVDEVTEALIASTSDHGDYGRDYKFGYGGLNIYDFLFGKKGEVTFDYGNGTSVKRTVVEGKPLQEYPFPAATDAPEGKEFAGWWLDKAGTLPIKYYQDVLPIGATVYAKWQKVGADGLSDGSGKDGGALDYTINRNGKLVVKGYYGNGERLILPKKLAVSGAEYEVSEIGARAFQRNSTLKKIVLPSSVTAVREYAFSNRTYEYFFLPSSITSVENHAFQNAKGTLYMQGNGNGFVSGWNSGAKLDIAMGTQEVTVKEGMELVRSNGTYTLLSYDGNARELTLTAEYPIVAIKASAFEGNETLEKLLAPDVAKIETQAFYGCTALTQVEIPQVASLADKAFYGCTALTHITLPASLMSLGNSAFADCSELVRVTVEKGCDLTTIGDYAFERCSALETIDLQNATALTYVGTNAFNGAENIFTAYIPDSVQTLGYNAFGGMKQLTSIRLPFLGRGVEETYTHLGYVFGASNKELQSSVIPENLTYVFVGGDVEKGALDGVTGLQIFADGNCPSATGCTVYEGGMYAFIQIYAGDILAGMLGGATEETLSIGVLNAAYRMPQGYSFTAWETGLDTTKLPAKNGVTAWKIVNEKNTYTVKFYNESGSLISSETYAYGEEVVVPSAPEKSSNSRYDYVFVGWGKPVTVAVADATYKATYEQVTRLYTVSFYMDNGDLIAEMEYAYGETPVAPAVPNRAIDAQYYDKFAGWNKSIATVAGDASYTAKFTKEYVQYIVRFAYEDGTVFAENSYRYGQQITAPSTARATDERYHYTFTGWDKTFETVTKEVTYKAKYEKTPVEYTVKFVDHNGGVIKTETLHYGDMPTPPETPARNDAEEGYRYLFLGWGSDVVAVTESVTYTATYKLVSTKIVVTFLNYDGTVLSQAEYMPGATVVVPENPERNVSSKAYYYDFKGWDKEVTTAEETVTYTAMYERTYYEFTVRFLDYDDTVLLIDTSLRYDSTVTPPEVPERYGYAFVGWDKEVVKVTADATYKAVYEEVEMPESSDDPFQSSESSDGTTDSEYSYDDYESSDIETSENSSANTSHESSKDVISNASKPEKKGCGSSLCFGSIGMLAIACAVVFKKKED